MESHEWIFYTKDGSPLHDKKTRKLREMCPQIERIQVTPG